METQLNQYRKERAPAQDRAMKALQEEAQSKINAINKEHENLIRHLKDEFIKEYKVMKEEINRLRNEKENQKQTIWAEVLQFAEEDVTLRMGKMRKFFKNELVEAYSKIQSLSNNNNNNC